MSSLEWLAPFSLQVRAVITDVATRPGKRVACLDADGTLWAEDIGEAFFRWLIAGHLLTYVDCNKDVYSEYEERVRKNRAEGYAWAVQCMAGLAERDVVMWCRQMAAAWPNYRPQMRELVKGLSKSGVDVWLVSASNIWLVRAAAPYLGADPEKVIAISVEVQDGVLTDRIVRPIICNEGKVEAIKEKIGRAPDLAVGDSLGDLEMLEYANRAVVIGRHDRADAPLLRVANERGWPVHLF